LQVAQLVAAHEAHPPPAPLTERLSPLLPLLTAEKSEIARVVCWPPQWAQGAGAPAWLIGRSLANVLWQSAQWYSYIGIATALMLATFYPRGPSCCRDRLARGGGQFGPQAGLLYNAFRIRSSAVGGQKPAGIVPAPARDRT